MRTLRNCLVVVACAAACAVGSVAVAAPCAGFTDVDDANGFCPNVEWLKNRAITLGCTSTTLYCPGDFVSRLAMAAFLNRLANALTPAAVGGIGGSSNADLEQNPIVCAQNEFAVTGSPRLAHGHAVLTVNAQGGNGADVSVAFVESTNNGATWGAVSPLHGVRVALGKSAAASAILPPRVLQVGTSYRYALRLSRTPGSTSTSDVGAHCEIKVFFENRNGASTPLDEHVAD